MKARYHSGTIDSLAEAVRYGHQIGLEIHAWFSINEDDHAWGWPSRYTVAHPEHRWKRRDGSYYRSQLSFAHPQVRSYKLAIVQEVLDNYPVDGLFIDWIRTGDVRDPQVDASGVADYGYEDIFARQIYANGRPGDLFIGISTSGNSPNIIRAIEAAREVGMAVVGLGGAAGGKMREVCDHCLCVPSNSTPRIQECQLVIEHIISWYIEDMLFNSVAGVTTAIQDRVA